MLLLFIYLFLAIGVSFLCSILEAVILSITPSYAEAMEQKGKRYAIHLKKLKKDIDRPLSAILSLNTIAHTVGAVGVGSQAAFIFGEAYLGIISTVLTILILVFSEIIPKTLGATFWRSLTPFAVYVLRLLIVLLYPLVLLSQGITFLLSRAKKSESVNRAEIFAMVDIGKKEGLFLESESQIMKNLTEFRAIRVVDIMTPKHKLVYACEEISLDKVYRQDIFLSHTRIPLYQQDPHNIVGYVHKQDLLHEIAENKHHLPLKTIKRPLIVIPPELTVIELLEKLIARKEQISLVYEQGSNKALGIVTMEDILETLLGMDIVDEYDPHFSAVPPSPKAKKHRPK